MCRKLHSSLSFLFSLSDICCQVEVSPSQVCACLKTQIRVREVEDGEEEGGGGDEERGMGGGGRGEGGGDKCVL